jgi:Tol biopolymer transport system component
MNTTSSRHLLVALLSGIGALAAIVSSPSRATSAAPNGLLAYQSMVGGHTQLFTVRPDGSGVRQVTHLIDSNAINAAWSPDGKRIAFVRNWNNGNKQQVYIMNADGSGLRSLGGKLRSTVAWLANVKLLTVRGLRFVIVNADGTGIRDAGIPGIPGDSPCMLRGTNQIAELVSRSDGNSAIFVGRIGGGNGSLKRLVPWEGINHIACSPDGSQITFNMPNYESSPQSSNVYAIKTDGTGLRMVTHNVGGKIDNIPDSWSPDGRKLAFISNRTDTFEIYSMNADGSGVTQITHGPEAHLASWGSHP